MDDQDERNKRKTKLVIITLIAIITILFAGIIYQFIVIKNLQNKLPQNPSANIEFINKKIEFNNDKFFF